MCKAYEVNVLVSRYISTPTDGLHGDLTHGRYRLKMQFILTEHQKQSANKLICVQISKPEWFAVNFTELFTEFQRVFFIESCVFSAEFNIYVKHYLCRLLYLST